MKFAILRDELKRHFERVNPLLISENGWHRSHYKIMEGMVNATLATSPLVTDAIRRTHGSTISYMTLKRFFDRQYDEGTIADLRFIKTIEKLCLYLGYTDYHTFFEVNERSLSTTTESNLEETLTTFIKEFMDIEFECFANKPKESESILSPFVVVDGPFFARLLEARLYFEKHDLSLITERKLSSYELVSFKVESAEADSCICATKEFWHMVYKINKTGRRIIYSKTSDHLYFLRKNQGNWQIWNHYDPDTVEFANYFERLESAKRINISNLTQRNKT